MGIYRGLLKDSSIANGFRAKYEIPDDVKIRLDDPANPLDGSVFYDGWMPFPLVAIVEGGVRFPIHPLFRSCLHRWRLSPCQLLPNGFRVIMGVVALNKILGIDLGVHDIEDTYDLCRSTGKDSYYLRVKAKRGSLINDLKDSNKYAGDDRLFVSGGWEFNDDEPVASRTTSVPRNFGTPPSAEQRRKEALGEGCKRNDKWFQDLYGYGGHNNRAAWSLLGYTPRYHSSKKRKVLVAEEGSQESVGYRDH